MPTDIEPLFISAFEEVAPEFEFFIKRDDQTGASLTGKSRNLSINFFTNIFIYSKLILNFTREQDSQT